MAPMYSAHTHERVLVLMSKKKKRDHQRPSSLLCSVHVQYSIYLPGTRAETVVQPELSICVAHETDTLSKNSYRMAAVPGVDQQEYRGHLTCNYS